MRAFLSEFTRNTDQTYTVMVMNEDGLEPPRQYRVRPRQVLGLWMGTVAALTLLFVGLVVLTPLRELIPGYSTEEIRQNARLNALRLAALQDSLAAQHQYMLQLRSLVTGQVDSAFLAQTDFTQLDEDPSADAPAFLEEQVSTNWEDHTQPALTVERMPVETSSLPAPVELPAGYLSSLQFPTLPPVEGFLTRSFDARTGHYAVDIAVEEGRPVRTIGSGYVIFSDWTQEGGFAIAVQHADGYVSVYKHNQLLLKRTGDRVQAHEPIALSGNSGEITTGPHLHFELWHNGLAQDPRLFFVTS